MLRVLTASLLLSAIAPWSSAVVRSAPLEPASEASSHLRPGDGYVEPVRAPVADRFRPPATPYGPGNRGWDYTVAAGTEVRAASGGLVTFAGQVGGRLFVTVAHPDGLRTSYSWLATLSVHAGQRVGAGVVIGTTGGTFHFGVRRGDFYIDPALILGRRHARLVDVAPSR